MHGGELTCNYSGDTRAAVEAAGFRYETMWRNGYYLPLHLPDGEGVMRCLSIGQHWADIIISPTPRFVEELCLALAERLARAEGEGASSFPSFTPSTSTSATTCATPRTSCGSAPSFRATSRASDVWSAATTTRKDRSADASRMI